MKSNISYKYDAFISYRQVNPDKSIANRLHRALENYKIPKDLVKEGFPKKLSKIFKDVDELSANPNLSKSIEKALIDSKYLIVICSPRTKESKWIKKEIDTFIALGREEKILTLIIEGEIDDSIPHELIDINKVPLAADIRDNKYYFIFDKLNEAKLKIISPIIGCDFDDLYRRDRRRSKLYGIIFTTIISIIAFILLILSINLNKSNKDLKKTNEKLNQAIFETSAIYAQFLLPVQDDYKKWENATNKLIEIINSKDIDRALKANDILAKYISLKGYDAGKGIDILPFWESPEYFLKTLFFRKEEFTTGHIEDRYMSLFLLDSLEFPSNLFLFLAEPPIELPDIYQRMQSDTINNDLIRYGYFLQAIHFESKNEHKKAIKSLEKASENGFFHSLTGALSPLSLDSIHNELYVFDDEKLKKSYSTNIQNERMMSEQEKLNLIKNLNIYFLISINYSNLNKKYVNLSGVDSKSISFQGSDYGKISYLNISNYLINNINSSNPEVNNFLESLKNPPLSDEESILKDKYIEEMTTAKNSLNKELTELVLETRSKLSDLMRDIEGSDEINTLLENSSGTKESVKLLLEDNFKNNIFLKSRDIRHIDTLISELSEDSLIELKSTLNIPPDISMPKEIRIYISKHIRPYRFSVKSYDYFVSNGNVLALLLKINEKEPDNNHIQFALARHWKIRGNDEKYDFYSSSIINDNYFRSIEDLLPKTVEKTK